MPLILFRPHRGFRRGGRERTGSFPALPEGGGKKGGPRKASHEHDRLGKEGEKKGETKAVPERGKRKQKKKGPLPLSRKKGGKKGRGREPVGPLRFAEGGDGQNLPD